MTKFIKTVVPTEGYQEVKQIGEKYVVHLDPTVGEDTTECYECIVDGFPDMEELEDELTAYKGHLAEVELEIAKWQKIAELEEYDQSYAVDGFTIGGQTMWLKVDERQQIATQINANEAAGRTEMTRWFGGHPFVFPLTKWRQMLTLLEVYAGDAINVTEAHKAAINALTSVAEVQEYDFTVGYPQKLEF